MTLLHETYEWCNIWFDHAEDAETPRVLLIGDSISCGYSTPVAKLLDSRVRVDRLGTSRSINDPALGKETAYVLGEFRYQVIHVNNGLHGKHLSDEEYADGIRAYLRLLRDLAGETPLIWAASTPVTVTGDVHTLEPEVNPLVLARNAVAETIMREAGIPVNDLYAAVIGQPDLRSTDGYHYNAQGYDVLAETVAAAIRPYVSAVR